MLSDFDFNAARRINTGGRFFLYYSLTNPSGLDNRLRVYADDRYLGTFAPGDYIEELPRQVNSWYIEPLTPGLAGRVFIGDGKARSNRVIGSVTVIDSSAEKTLAGLQFWGAPSVNAAPGLIKALGLRATTRPLVVRRLAVSSPTAGIVRVWFCGGAPIPANSGFANLPNKLAGAADVACNVDKATVSAAVMVAGVDYASVVGIASLSLPVNTPTDYPVSGPVVLPVGQGIVVTTEVVNRDMTVYYDGEAL